MTPKQKAYKLRYLISIALDLKTDDVKVLKCALIAVDEILEIAPKNTEQIKYSDGTYAREYREIPNRYWKEVKQEIEKL